jgi:hypothetical protein
MYRITHPFGGHDDELRRVYRGESGNTMRSLPEMLHGELRGVSPPSRGPARGME